MTPVAKASTTEEPDAGKRHVRVCVGSAQVTGRSTTTRGAKTKSIARLIAVKKMGFPLLIKCGGYDHLPKEVVA